MVLQTLIYKEQWIIYSYKFELFSWNTNYLRTVLQSSLKIKIILLQRDGVYSLNNYEM